jgi:hypothetical protein
MGQMALCSKLPARSMSRVHFIARTWNESLAGLYEGDELKVLLVGGGTEELMTKRALMDQ